MARILIADDDSHIREVVRFALESAGHEVTEAADGRQAVEHFRQQPCDLVVLDVLMPEWDGLEVCRRIRETSEVPILFLSSRDEEVDRILGLELGADDYVTKPFSPRELVARVKARLRRPAAPPKPEAADRDAEPLAHGALRLDPRRHECRWQKSEVTLTATEFMVLRALMAHPDRVYSRSELVERAYGFSHVRLGQMDERILKVEDALGRRMRNPQV